MTAEGIVAAAVAGIGIAPIIILGISQYRSKAPVGFWSGAKPPQKEQITDVEAYNRGHGLMWILYGAGFLLCFLIGACFGYEEAAILSMAEIFGGLFFLIINHYRLERMYLKKEPKKE